MNKIQSIINRLITELTNFLSDFGVSTIENALPLPLFTTAALTNYVPKSIAKIWLVANITNENKLRIYWRIFIYTLLN
jgi:hypothetical protein